MRGNIKKESNPETAKINPTATRIIVLVTADTAMRATSATNLGASKILQSVSYSSTFLH